MELSPNSGLQVSVIIPARNEEETLGRCLESLVSQTGLCFEIVVVDDHSTDRTAEIARKFAGVRVLKAPPLPSGWTGKNSALAFGASQARGEWLLFTDADTCHKPGSLRAAVIDSQTGGSLVSYSPEQELVGFWQRAVMPLIFGELATTYRPSSVSNPGSADAAANGQYILITREAYDAVGGHAAIAGSLLEDVDLARNVKASGRRLMFRYGGDRVSTRMYRSTDAMIEGWSKNLALLFKRPRILGTIRLLEFLLLFWMPLSAIYFASRSEVAATAIMLVATVAGWRNMGLRVSMAHIKNSDTLVAFFGLPVFAYLLWRSSLLHRKGEITWKGRTYTGSESAEPPYESNIQVEHKRAAGA